MPWDVDPTDVIKKQTKAIEPTTIVDEIMVAEAERGKCRRCGFPATGRYCKLCKVRIAKRRRMKI